MPYIDIIIFAVIAVLLVLRLKSVLGQRTGFEQPQEKQPSQAASVKSGSALRNVSSPWPLSVPVSAFLGERYNVPIIGPVIGCL